MTELSLEGARLTSLLEFAGGTALDALDRWVAEQPDKVAVTYGETGESFTYARWGRLTDDLAGGLVASGVGPGDRVVVFTASPLVAATWMYAAWKARAVYTPINPAYRDMLLDYTLRDAAPRLLVADADLLDHVSQVGVPDGCLVLSAGGDHPGARRAEELAADQVPPPARPRWHEPANVIYTSGTTGPAKGVVLSHRWVGSYTWRQRMVTSPDDVVHVDLPMYHVGAALLGFAGAVWAGSSAWLWDRFSASAYWDRIEKSGATMAGFLDVMMPHLMSAVPRPDDRANTLNKVIMQPLPLNHHEVATRFGIDFVFAGFGQTESGLPISLVIEEVEAGAGTPESLYRGYAHADLVSRFEKGGVRVAHGPEVTEKGVMGAPIPFYEASVLDELDQECPVGVPGQLAIRPRLPGTILTEYLGKPAETSSALRNAWFHTGDSARRNEDGSFTFVDRISNRIRVRGENVSSYHVEDVLVRHADVDLAAVVGVPSAIGDEDEIVAFVVTDRRQPADLAAVLEAHCAESLPRFMRPSRFIAVDELPVTPTNKIEKYRLRHGLLEGQYDS